jgi:hypothetical protein
LEVAEQEELVGSPSQLDILHAVKGGPDRWVQGVRELLDGAPKPRFAWRHGRRPQEFGGSLSGLVYAAGL